MGIAIGIYLAVAALIVICGAIALVQVTLRSLRRRLSCALAAEARWKNIAELRQQSIEGYRKATARDTSRELAAAHEKALTTIRGMVHSFIDKHIADPSAINNEEA